MKRSTKALLGVALAWSSLAAAEPAKPTIEQAIRHANFKPGVSCKAASPGRVGSQSQLYQNTRTKEIVSKKEFWFEQALECRVPGAIPGFPKARRMFDGSASFHSLGGAWTFDGWHEWDTWLEGMPPPDTAAVEKAIEDRLAVIDWNFLTRTTQIYSYGLRPKAEVLWRDTTVMKTQVEAVVDAWDGGDLVKQRVVIDVQFRRDDPSAPWKAFPGDRHPTELSRRRPSDEEAKQLVSVIVQEKQRAAEARLAVLPKVEVPAFETARDAQLFVYQVLLKAPRDEAEASLRRLASTVNEEELAAALKGQAQFKEEYCPAATFKTDNPAGVENKLGSSWTSIKVGQEGGELKNGVTVNQQWKLRELRLGLLTGDKLKALKSFTFDLCSGTLPTPSGGTWKGGDWLDAKNGSQWYSGELTQVAAGGGWVKKTEGQHSTTTWHSLDQLREATAPRPAAVAEAAPLPAPTVKAAPVELPLPFAIGDRVEGNPPHNARWFPGTVAGFNSARTKVQIKYDDKTSDYLPFDKVRKRP